MDNSYLAHYGVLGMKWGVRRYQPYSIRGRLSGKGGREVGEAKKKGPSHDDLVKSTNAKQVYKYRDQLSDKELRDRVNRIQTEQQLKQLTGKSFASQFFTALKGAAITAAATAVVAAGKKVIGEIPVSEIISTASWMSKPWYWDR